MYNERPQLRPVAKRYASGVGALDHLFYELKPLIYSGVALYALKAGYTNMMLVKFACFAVIVFAAYIAYARLYHRGHL